MRTYTWRAYHDILTVVHRLLHQREVERAKVGLQAVRIEMPDIGLALGFACRLVLTMDIGIAVVIRPSWFQMQTEHRTVSLFKTRKELFEIVQASLATGIVVAPAPPTAIEPRTRCVHHAVEYDVVTVGINKPPSFDMKARQRFHALGHNSSQTDSHGNQEIVS